VHGERQVDAHKGPLAMRFKRRFLPELCPMPA
jgi:hypothetical protein